MFCGALLCAAASAVHKTRERGGDMGKRWSSPAYPPGTRLNGPVRPPCVRTNTAALDAVPLKRQICGRSGRHTRCGIPPAMPMQLPQYAPSWRYFHEPRPLKGRRLPFGAIEKRAAPLFQSLRKAFADLRRKSLGSVAPQPPRGFSAGGGHLARFFLLVAACFAAGWESWRLWNTLSLLPQRTGLI